MESVVAAQVRRPPARGRPAPRPVASKADARDAGAGLLGLQQLAGNRAVASLVQRKSRVQERFDNLEDGHGLSSPIMSGDQELEGCFDGHRVLKPGASGAPVGKLRQALAQVGFASTDAADKYGPSTTKAVQSFQKKVGLSAG
ncbi:MAG: peptidoglycan-binding domain-containing protein [Pseudonocardiaceae bacterium]